MSTSNSGRRPEVVAIYYPHWHNYDHSSSWKGEGWTEWEGLKAAVPRFPGHHHPLKPTWGCFDESDPEWAAKEIDLAADHGIDVFMYDWYWYSGVRNMQEALEQGFLGAPNRGRMRFCLMWANHDRTDQFCPEPGARRNVWLPSRHSPRDINRVVDYCIEHYFREPNYWRVDGGLYFNIYQPVRFITEIGGPEATRGIFQAIDSRLEKEGLPPMHWAGMTKCPNEVHVLKDAGFKSTSRYNVNSAKPTRAIDFEDYEGVIEAHKEHWERMVATDLVNIPIITMGYDPTPRCRQDVPWPFTTPEYPYVSIITENTPERFKQLCQDAADSANSDPKSPPAVLI
ncbi:glycoside hydrolase family 99-like domain-containing protein, partial [bacterium]|nr:glycoside hydrolase family 99-like domain-containing protein [bacterium]